MTSRLRALERQLACQRAQLTIEPLAESFADAWRQALGEGTTPPDGLDFIAAVTDVGVLALAPNPVITYLEQCATKKRTPDPAYLIMATVHGLAARRFAEDARCRCPAHAPLALPYPIVEEPDLDSSFRRRPESSGPDAT
jgi:hypothetical protein